MATLTGEKHNFIYLFSVVCEPWWVPKMLFRGHQGQDY